MSKPSIPYQGIINYLGLQLGWLACALGAARGLPWIGPVIVAIHVIIHLWWSPHRKRELYYVLSVGLLGTGVDSVLKVTGLITYASDIPLEWLAPLWITAMWVLFATAFSSSLAWLQGRYGMSIVLGGIFGPLSYIAGERLEGIEFNYSLLITISVLVIVWGSVTPALVWLAKKIKQL